LNECLVELEFLGVAVFVELDDEIGVEIEENVDPFDQFLENFKGPLSLYDSRFPQGLLQVVNDLDVPLLCFLDVLALPGLHSVTPARKIYTHPPL
jgi:hypothetical protein